MADVVLICGRICSGKSFYAKNLAEKMSAVTLSCDEVSADIFHHSEGENFDTIAADIKRYLHKIAARIVKAGGKVVLDWGFWTKNERREVSEYYAGLGISFEWHYISIPADEWQRNIELRNASVLAGETTDFYVDDGLMQKLLDRFEDPERDEIDVWHEFERL